MVLAHSDPRCVLKFKGFNNVHIYNECRSPWQSGLGRGPPAARLLGLRVRIPPRHACLCCVVSKDKMQDKTKKQVRMKYRAQENKKILAGSLNVCFPSSVVYGQIEVSATGWSLVQRSFTDYDVFLWSISLKPWADLVRFRLYATIKQL
jgi:hypothetical protein